MLSRLLVLVCAFAAAVCAPAVVAPLAAAQDDEVFVDPGSPSGKEYELPIDRARQQAGSSTKKQSAPQKAPLFGEGVEGGTGGTSAPPQTPDRPAVKRDKGTTETSSKARSKRAKQRAADERRAEAATRARAAEERAAELARTQALRAEAAAPEGGTGLAVIIAAGIGVLLVGGLIGLWLRRRATA